MNGDGFDDLFVGAPRADANGNVDSGASYIVYGFATGDTGQAANTVLTGTDLAETLNGGLGNDRIDGGLGNDVLIGGAGNDTLVYDAADTLRVDGGTGRDTLAITGSGITLDLTALNNFADTAQTPKSPYKSIEIIDLTGMGDNTLRLDASDLLHIVGSATGTDDKRDNNLLRIDGDAGDTVQLTSGTWTRDVNDNDLNGEAAPGNGGYSLYTNGQARLLVDNAITVALPPAPPVAVDDAATLAVAGEADVLASTPNLLGNSNSVSTITLQPGREYVFTLGGGGDPGTSGSFALTAGENTLIASQPIGAGGQVVSYTYTGTEPLVATAAVTTVGNFLFLVGLTEQVRFLVTELEKTGNVLTNDTDANGDVLTVTAARAGDEIETGQLTLRPLVDSNLNDALPATVSLTGDYGTLVINADGSYTYNLATSNSDYAVLAKGETVIDAFTYRVSDGNGGTDRATLTFKVIGQNDAPIAMDDTATVTMGTTSVSSAAGMDGERLGVLGNDTDADTTDTLSVSAARAGTETLPEGTTAPALTSIATGSIGTEIIGTYGTLTLKADGSYTYAIDTSDDDYLALAIGSTASDSFTYVVSDGQGSSDTATLAVSLTREDIRLSEIQLADLDGTNGFKLLGVAAEDYSGRSVSSAGDVNGDGFDDVIVGADRVDATGKDSGASYVVFGGTSVGTDGNLNLSALNGTNGFKLSGAAAYGGSGYSVSSAGDVNGDGFDDLIIGASRENQFAGVSYVVFGGTAVGTAGNLNLSDLNGENGFKLSGVAQFDFSGSAVSSAGDVNGDGFDDLIVGARSATTNVNNQGSGVSYVVFGGTSVGTAGNLNLSALNGTNGFTLSGVAGGDQSGRSVSSAGDVNGDGFDDLIVGASGVDTNARGSGASYVVFGGSSVGTAGNLNLSALNGTNGFTLLGSLGEDYSGSSVSSAGDVNGDGFNDLIVGAYGVDTNGSDSGASYVVFGGTSVGTAGILNLSDLNGANGFKLSGIAPGDFSGRSVSSAGDVNGDGFDDLIVGASAVDANGNDSGASYVVFGGSSVGTAGNLNLSALNGTNGFTLSGVAAGDFSGRSVSSAGDVNGDGFDDLFVGARSADPSGTSSGASYVVYGFATGDTSPAANNVLTGTDLAETLNGGLGNDRLDGGLGNDVLIGGAGNDTLIYDVADTLVVDGGNGRDTLAITGFGVTLDLTALNSFSDVAQAPKSPYENIEIIDLTGTGNNTLRLNTSDLLHIVGSATGADDKRDNNLLRVDGDAGDKVQLTSGTWTPDINENDLNGEDAPSNGGYILYTNGQARLLVDKDVTVEQPVVAAPQARVPNELVTSASNVNGLTAGGPKVVMGFDRNLTETHIFGAALGGYWGLPENYLITGIAAFDVLNKTVTITGDDFSPPLTGVVLFTNNPIYTETGALTYRDGTLLPDFAVEVGSSSGGETWAQQSNLDLNLSSSDPANKVYVFTGGGVESISASTFHDVFYSEEAVGVATSSLKVTYSAANQLGDTFYNFKADDSIDLAGVLATYGDEGFSVSEKADTLSPAISISGDIYKLLVTGNGNDSVDESELSDLSQVAALLNARFELLDHSLTGSEFDGIVIVQADDAADAYGVYLYKPADTVASVAASELQLLSVVYADNLSFDQFADRVGAVTVN